MVTAMLTGPGRVTRPVTSTVAQESGVRGPDDATTAPAAGASAHVAVASSHVTDSTRRTSSDVFERVTYRRSVAWTMGRFVSATSKRSRACRSGEPSTHSRVAVLAADDGDELLT